MQSVLKRVLCVLPIAFLCSNIFCQISKNIEYPVIDAKIPDVAFNIDSSNRILTTGSIRRPMIIDFFSVGCVSCFASFPKMNALYLKYNEKVDFLLVGREHPLIRKSFRLYQAKYNIQIPVSYDSVVFEQFKITGVPCVIFIDKDGIVKAVTNEVSEEKLQQFLAGEQFSFYNTSYAKVNQVNDFDADKPFLLYGNGGADSSFLQRSLIAKWKDGDPKFDYGDMFSFQAGKKPLQMLGHPLVSLYRMAYFGTYLPWSPFDMEKNAKIHFSPIVKIRDSSLIKVPYFQNPLFNYSLIVPKDKMDIQTMMEIMQRDLENFFGFRAKLEMHKMPYLKLVAKGRARRLLRSRSADVKMTTQILGVELKNAPIAALISALNYNFALVYNDLPLVDKTRIKDKIDLKIEAAMTDWSDVLRALNKNGLDIKRARKRMRVLVIED